jgi:hypothetical protein
MLSAPSGPYLEPTGWVRGTLAAKQRHRRSAVVKNTWNYTSIHAEDYVLKRLSKIRDKFSCTL